MTVENKRVLELQKIMLEILLEQPEMSMNQEDLFVEAFKRQQRIKAMSDLT